MRIKHLIFFFFIFLVACRKQNNSNDLPAANGLVVNVTIDQSKTGYTIPSDFQGLSYETGILAESPEVLNENNKVFIQLIKNLGNGLLRIGGDSSDETFWTGKTRSAVTGIDSLTTSDIDRLAAFSNATGWPVFFGLNLGKNDGAVALNEALYVNSKLAGNLFALQTGNEPDVYHLYGLRKPDYSSYDYLNEYENYQSSIIASIPNANFSGPGTAYNTDFISAFAQREHQNIKLLDAHYYVDGPASDPSINYQVLFQPNWKLDNILNVISTESKNFNLPFRITETNSIYGGGKADVSDIFASALWALDFMWQITDYKGAGINFHGGNGLIYSPIKVQNGVVTAMPEYYAMLAFKYGTQAGKTIPLLTDKVSFNISAHGCTTSDGSKLITLINKNNSQNISFRINIGRNKGSIQINRLVAPTIQSKTGISFAGGEVNADGSFVPVPESYSASNYIFTINVPAGSAAVVKVN